MTIRNVRYIQPGVVAAEIGEHFCSGILQASIEARDGEIPSMIADWIGTGNVVAPYVPPPLTADGYAAGIQAHVDATAKARGYADGTAFAGYSTSTIPAWAAEAATFVAWRDAVWIYAYTQLAKVQGGQRAMPTLSDFVAELPAIKWP